MGHGYVMTLGKLFTPYVPVTKQYNLVPVNKWYVLQLERQL